MAGLQRRKKGREEEREKKGERYLVVF